MEEEKWTPVIIKHFGSDFEKGIEKRYEVSDRCRIRNVGFGKISKAKGEQICLVYNGVKKMLIKHRLCLASFSPDEIPENIDDYDVDHIDGFHSNMRLDNLQWIMKSEHSKKTMAQTKDTRKSLVEKTGKAVIVVDVRGTVDSSFRNRTFDSVSSAAKNIGLSKGGISGSARNGWWVGGYMFEYVEQPLLNGEIFRRLGSHEMSNMGRLKNKYGKITTGARCTNSRYSKAYVKLDGDEKPKKYYMHILIYRAFKGPVPKGEVLMHNDKNQKVTRDQDGFERNWLVDLKTGTQKENAQSFHNNNRNSKRVRCLENDTVYLSAAAAGRKLGLSGSSIYNICNKRVKTCSGLRFEYVDDSAEL
jgi:hypothetical protein